MARRRRDRDQPQRDHISITRVLLPKPLTLLQSKPVSDPRRLEDRRRYHPERRHQPAAATHRQARRLVPGTKPNTLHKIRFAIPNRVAICVRRKVRREVIHALRMAGRGSTGRRRRTWQSAISCR